MADVGLVLRAASFAAEAHRDQRRKDPSAAPYINHPLAVADILANEAGVTDASVLAAALLHDVVEDTAVTLPEVRAAFGDAVADIVAQVTDDKSLPAARRKELQVETAPHKAPGAKLVKLADKLHNLRCLEVAAPVGWDAERVAGYFAWAARVVQGLRGASPPLEAALDAIFARRGVAV